MSRRLRVLHVHCRYREPGGEDAVVAAERAALSARGVDVVALDAVNPTAPATSAGALALAPWNPWTYAAVRRRLRDTPVDVAHIHNTWFALSPSIVEALHRAKVPVVVTVHNFRLACVNGLLFRDGQVCTDCVGRSSWRGVAHRCYRSSALASAAVATTTSLNRALRTWTRGIDRFLVLNELASRVLTASGVPPSRVGLTANFVADPGPRKHSPAASRTIVYVGRLAYEKGIDVLLRAWRAWRPSEDWTLVVAGDGPMRRQLNVLTDDRVRFVGRLARDEVTDLLLRSRALILPSLVFENQPMVALEAFAAGLPVLGRGIGGTLEVVRPLGTSWLVHGPDVPEWTSAMNVLADDTMVDAAGATARLTYDRTYTSAHATRRTLDVYEDLNAGARIGVR